MPFSFPPSLPPRRQSCRRIVGWGAGRERLCLFYSQLANPGCFLLYRLDTQLCEPNGTQVWAVKSAETQRPESKRHKSPAKPRKNLIARCEVGQSPLNFRFNPVRLHRESTDRPGQRRLIHVPPSLGAQYQGLWKTCQEKFTLRPQNLRQKLSKASTGSGACAEIRMLLFF